MVVYFLESHTTSVVANVPPVLLPPDPDPAPLPEPPTMESVQEPAPPIDPEGDSRPDHVEELCLLAVQPRDARLTLIAIEPIRSRKTFWVSAIVQHAKDGQTVEMKMSNGLKLAKGHDSIKPVPRNEGYSPINWLVEVPTRTTGTAEISARLNPDGAQESTAVTIQSGNLFD